MYSRNYSRFPRTMQRSRRRYLNEYNRVGRIGRPYRNRYMNEALSDLKPQAIFLMGLPAAGKSTFLNNELSKHLSVGTVQTTNSDNQLVAIQFEKSVVDFKLLKDAFKRGRDAFERTVDSMTYFNSNSGKYVDLPVTYEWFLENNPRHPLFYKTFRKDYYATYFNMRETALKDNKKLTVKKVSDKRKRASGGDALIFDGTGSNVEKIRKQMEQVKAEGFKTVIIFLDIDVELSVVRDDYRGKTEGRTVGETVIRSYVDKLDNAYRTYSRNERGLIDTLYRFEWIQQGDSPIKGRWKLVDKKNFELDAQLSALRNR